MWSVFKEEHFIYWNFTELLENTEKNYIFVQYDFKKCLLTRFIFTQSYQKLMDEVPLKIKCFLKSNRNNTHT